MNKHLKRIIELRARGCCEYCLSPVMFSHDPFCIEHIFPMSKGGNWELSNLAFSCQGCNGHKSVHTVGKDTLDDVMVPLFHPRQDLWAEHFEWQNNFQLIVGLTSTGRTTIHRLQLNRPGLQKLRKILVAAGVHPPF